MTPHISPAGATERQAGRVREDRRNEGAHRPESLLKTQRGHSCAQSTVWKLLPTALCALCRSACLSTKVICIQACLGTHSFAPGEPQALTLLKTLLVYYPSPFYQGGAPSSGPADPVPGATAVRPMSPDPQHKQSHPCQAAAPGPKDQRITVICKLSANDSCPA